MASEKVKVCGGILVTRSESGTSKIQRVLVEAKPGRSKGRVKCRLQKFLRPSRIPVLIKNRKVKKSVHSSIVSVQENFLDKDEDTSVDPSSKGDCKVDQKSENIAQKKILQMEEIAEESEAKLVMSDSAVDLLYENKDSAIHADFPEYDDCDGCLSLTRFQACDIQKSPTIVMTQYSTIIYKPREEDRSQSGSEFEIIEKSDTSSDSETQRRYIDSGLRRLRSHESRLFLDEFVYKPKRKPPVEDEDDGVAPLLEELPSDIFQPPKTPKRLSSKSLKSPSKEDSGSYDSQEDEESETSSEASDIDTGPLDKLKELEDKSYIISPRDLIDDGETSRHSELGRRSRLDRYSESLRSGLATRDRSLEGKDLSRLSRDTSRLSGLSTPIVPIPFKIRSRSLSKHSVYSWRDVSFPLIDSIGPSTESLDLLGRPSVVDGPLIESVGPSTESVIQEIGKLSRLVKTPTKEEFCVHTRDVPDDKYQDFSSTSFKPQKHRRPFKNKYEDFCVHTRDPPPSPPPSPSLHQLSKRSHFSRDRSIRAINPSKSQGFSTISLIDNKEARRSKFSKKSKNW